MNEPVIRWVVTPPCRLCTPTVERKRRPPCIGCLKQPNRPEPPAKEPKTRLRVFLRQKRDREILSLWGKGYSLSEIGGMYRIPRATAYNAILRYRKSGKAALPRR